MAVGDVRKIDPPPVRVTSYGTSSLKAGLSRHPEVYIGSWSLWIFKSSIAVSNSQGTQADKMIHILKTYDKKFLLCNGYKGIVNANCKNSTLTKTLCNR